jgi:hypothetical protein
VGESGKRRQKRVHERRELCGNLSEPAHDGGRFAALAPGITASLLSGVTSATATPPGQNGLISYRVYCDADHTTGALFVANPDGSHPTEVVDPGAGNLDTNQNWSPDGAQLVYEHDTPDASSIRTIVLGTTTPHTVVPCPG